MSWIAPGSICLSLSPSFSRFWCILDVCCQHFSVQRGNRFFVFTGRGSLHRFSWSRVPLDHNQNSLIPPPGLFCQIFPILPPHPVPSNPPLPLSTPLCLSPASAPSFQPLCSRRWNRHTPELPDIGSFVEILTEKP